MKRQTKKKNRFSDLFNVVIRRRKNFTKNGRKVLEEFLKFERDYEDFPIRYEFRAGKRIIGTCFGYDLGNPKKENSIYLDFFCIAEKYRMKGYGRKCIGLIQEMHRHISVEATEDAKKFWQRCGFHRRRNQDNRIYGNTIDMYI